MQNSFKLLIIALVLSSLSATLFYFGLTQDNNQTNLPDYSSSSNSPSPVASVLGDEKASDSAAIGNKQNRQKAFVTKIIDGDTIEVDIAGKAYKLRYIGINTPETVDPRRKVQCFGKEASNENKSLVDGKEVLLEKDISETDKYGRLLRYVYLPMPDGTLLFVNDYLVRQGFANVDTYPPDIKYVDRFKAAEKEAREGKKGLWGKC